MSLQPADKKPSKALEEDLTVASDHALEPFQGEDDDKVGYSPFRALMLKLDSMK